MDHDQVSAELRVITEQIGPLDAKAVTSAKGILDLPRYAEAAHSADALVADLTKIISKLPDGMTAPARLLFSLSEEGTNITHRKEESGVQGRAWTWLRTAVLLRIAVAILEAQDSAPPLAGQPGFRIDYLVVSTSLRQRSAVFGLPTVRLGWVLSGIHPRARVFTFCFDSPSPLDSWRAERSGQRALGQVPVISAIPDHHGHFFAIDLGDNPLDSLGEENAIGATLVLKTPVREHRFIEYTVTDPLETLNLTVVLPKRQQECQLIEFESAAPDAPIVSTRPAQPIVERAYVVPTLIPRPVIGRRYRLEWEPQGQNLLTSLLHR
jgi:hypothetical protein